MIIDDVDYEEAFYWQTLLCLSQIIDQYGIDKVKQDLASLEFSSVVFKDDDQ